jgi:hypothetical protein
MQNAKRQKVNDKSGRKKNDLCERPLSFYTKYLLSDSANAHLKQYKLNEA